MFAEFVALGKPVIATRGTWMAEQIEAGRAAGTIIEELQPDAIAQAVARCVAELESLQQSARHSAPRGEGPSASPRSSI